ncbi:MAG TPA: OsmC family peroxiredoxin, partial [Bacteroidia bacterium]
MITSKVVYKGKLRTEATHLESGTVIITDAPKDNHGNGES